MEFGEDAVQARVARQGRELARQFDLDYWREHDRTETYPSESLAAFAAAGWFGTCIPTGVWRARAGSQ